MRPATRVVAKPMIPVVDRPVIQYVVEEAVEAGITEVILVVDERPGNPVLSHFTEGPAMAGLEQVSFVAVTQSQPMGLGDAVLTARSAVGDRPFMCLLSDMFPRPGRSFSGRLASQFDGRLVLAVRRVPPDFFDRYGIVTPAGEAQDGVLEVAAAVEKPGAGAASDLAIVGRYVFSPEIFDDLEAIPAGHGGEIQLTDAIDRAARRSGARAVIVGDDLLDVGMPSGLLEATAAVGLSRPELAADFRQALHRLLDEDRPA